MTIFNSFSWGQLLFTAFTLLLLYFILRFLLRILPRVNFLLPYHRSIKKVLHGAILLFEPLSILLLFVVFIFINLPVHGTIAIMLVAFGFRHFRNYLSGQVLKFDPAMTLGRQLKTGNFQGIISSIGNFGLKIRTGKGMQFLDYNKLINDGYLFLSSDEISGYYQLNISDDSDQKLKGGIQKTILDLLAFSPFLDWDHKPVVSFVDEEKKNVQVKILVKEENHLQDLISMIKNQGYSCEMIEA